MLSHRAALQSGRSGWIMQLREIQSSERHSGIGSNNRTELAAANRSLPVIIHCVRAYNDLIPILRHYPHVTPVIHGFTGSPELAERLLQAGGYLSFGHRTAASPKTRQALAAVPVDRGFLRNG